ncbi:exodeoxyribonuclease VII small subunit [Granulicella tundricola]|uniref:Exodeoxyribonuclease 7 small subunit n=1 Tax=Granulicella tundricola (strain ATCC BAA-1859 / DSM 23138 / MP5ACTX9) TaxID=1198114 RepID=E8WWG6_GRATM|nr:exodeoxyribonuclease VII small subunit [Granulicella tundricola]ADW69630.1 exodeoxyribonuclease VII, small subunit [Granulicella tundricola MP5ACTX9]
MATFEDKLTALEAVVERLERGELSLDESVRLFEEGVQLSNSCKAELERAEGRVQVLVETRGNGKVEDLELPDTGDDEEEDDDEIEDLG